MLSTKGVIKRMRNIVVWCIGNPLLQDDGAGSALFGLLQGRAIEQMSVVNCETTPENYIASLTRNARGGPEENPAILLIVDAAEMGLPGGSIRRMRLEDFGNIAFGTHGVPLPLLLGPLLPTLEVIVLGIQPANRGFGDALSPEVFRAVETLAPLLMEKRWNEVEPYQENCSPR